MADPPRFAPIRALSKPRRRVVCRYFVESDATVADLDDLVEYVVRRECRREGQCPNDHRRTVTIQLYHVHLPVLADAGVLDFDPRSTTVRYRGDARVEELLYALSDDEKVCA